MAPKIFATGTTGYIGGDALVAIVEAHPDYDIACLVRNSDQGGQLTSKFSKIRCVYGDLDSADLITEEAKKADVVLHFAHADHEASANAIIKGLSEHAPDHPGYLIHTSGTGILLVNDLDRGVFGEPSDKVYDDWENIEEVTSLPDNAPHRNVDKIVLAAAKSHGDRVKTAIVCPPLIYGQGRGPGNQRSQQLPDLTKATLENKKGFHVGPGKHLWNNVHVSDLSMVYLALLEAAVAGGGKATWGEKGYYFGGNGEHVWDDLSRKVASDAHKKGLIDSAEVDPVSTDEADKLHHKGIGSRMWGANSRSKSIRARELLGWQPKGETIEEEIPKVVDREARALGLIQGHAAKVAG
ncbi:hypothetical protein MMC25_001685 [Agyrium rufum]|nr:hypothetical protein [Agyrium rufum]